MSEGATLIKTTFPNAQILDMEAVVWLWPVNMGAVVLLSLVALSTFYRSTHLISFHRGWFDSLKDSLFQKVRIFSIYGKLFI